MNSPKTALISAIALGLLAGSTIGAAAQEEPVEVFGQVTLDGSVERWATDDPRLSGDGTWDPAEGNTREPMPDYFLNGRYLETDEGLWRQLPIPTVNIEGFGNPREREDDRHFDMVLIGEGGYEGLVFIAQATWTEPGFAVRGYIVKAAES